MKFFKVMVLSGLLALVGTVQAQNGIERTYKQSKGAPVTLVRQGDQDVRSDGQVDVLNSWGNRISRGSPDSPTSVVAFSPHNGQLPEEPFAVGYKWRHTYQVKAGTESPYNRTRACEVKQQAAVTVGVHTYEQAWQVTCSNQREFRQLALNEVTWYTSDRILITHTESWGGSSPGSFTAELVAPPQVSMK